jgi:hypothetical protein
MTYIFKFNKKELNIFKDIKKCKDKNYSKVNHRI